MKIKKLSVKEIKSDFKFDKVVGILHAATQLIFFIIFLVISYKLFDGHIVYKLIIVGFFVCFFCISSSQMYNANLIRKVNLEIRELKK